MKNLFKKILLTIGIIVTVSISFNFTNQQPASAAFGCRYFLGMTSWDCHVIEKPKNNSELKTNIWTIVANVATDITVAAAYLIIGYVIYGGYLYTFSGGDPNKVATGKKALYQAFLGFAIVMSANIILNSIRIALGANFNANCASENCGIDPGTMVTNAIQWVIGVAGVVSAIFVVYGGISYTTSAGDPGKVKKAKDMITYALIGLAIVALSEIIVAFVSNIINDANKNASTNTNSAIISNIKQNTFLKEQHET